MLGPCARGKFPGYRTLTPTTGVEEQRLAPRAGGSCHGEEGRDKKAGDCAVVENEEKVFPGDHRASVLRAVIKASKRKREKPALGMAM